MSIVMEVKDAVVEAKRKYDKEKYIDVLEENLKKYENEIERLNGQLSKFIDKDFIINADHLELFNIYRNDINNFHLDYLKSYSKKNIDLEIALSQLLEEKYFAMPSVYAMGGPIRLSIPEDKKIKLLLALKRMSD